MSKVTQQTDTRHQRQAMGCFPNSCAGSFYYTDGKQLAPMTGKSLRAKIHKEDLLGILACMRNIVPNIPRLQLIDIIWKGQKASACASWTNIFSKQPLALVCLTIGKSSPFRPVFKLRNYNPAGMCNKQLKRPSISKASHSSLCFRVWQSWPSFLLRHW